MLKKKGVDSIFWILAILGMLVQRLPLYNIDSCVTVYTCVFIQVHFQQLMGCSSAGCTSSYLQVLKLFLNRLDSHSNQMSLAMLANSASFSRAFITTHTPKQIPATFYCLIIFLGFDEEKEEIFC